SGHDLRRHPSLRGRALEASSPFSMHDVSPRFRRGRLPRGSEASGASGLSGRVPRGHALRTLLRLWTAGSAFGSMVHIENLRFGYDGTEVLRLDVFDLPAADNVLVVGPSGCGKTTLLHLVAGLLLPVSGRVVVAGQDLGALSAAARDRFRGRNIGIVLQQFHLLPTLTALQNLLVAQSIAGLPVDRPAAHASLATLGVDDRH